MILSDLINRDLDFSSLTVEKINELVSIIETGYKITYEPIAALQEDQLSFATVIQPMIDLELCVMKASSLCTFPMQVHPDKAVREMSGAAVKKLEEMNIDYSSREAIYKIVKKYETTSYLQEMHQLDSEQMRFVNDLLVGYKRAGLMVEDEQTRMRITEIKTRIAELSVSFNKNYNEVDVNLYFTKSELAGLPEDWLAEKTPDSNGNYEVSIKYTDYFPVMEYATHRDTRRKMYRAYMAQCMDENLPILRETLLLRHELAKLLGYPSFADYALELRLAKNAATVQQFLHDMNERFTPLLANNLEALTSFARAKENDSTFILEISDMRYYLRLREEAVCEINMDEIKEYFPLEKVVKGTLSVYELLLGLKFTEVSNQSAWHKDVKYYLVKNANSEDIIGSFYLDLHPRDGKYGHAAVFDLAVSCDISSVTKCANDRLNPVAAMVCNFSQNTSLSFEEVVTFFHEFGHVMHVICGKTKLPSNSSFKTETDFLEAPSQMLENWCYESSVLTQISQHPKTHQPLPRAMAEKLKQKEKLHAGYVNKGQLVYGLMDFTLHTMSSEEIQRLDFVEYANRIQQAVLKLAEPANVSKLASFTHLLGGYEAGYYGYMMSLTYAADMYAAQFKQDPLSAEAGNRYRKCVLEPGSSKDGMDLIEDFLGRKPNIDAFLEMCGLPMTKVSEGSMFTTTQHINIHQSHERERVDSIAPR